RDTERESRRRGLSERERAKPKCAPYQEDSDSRARRTQHDRYHDHDERRNPDDPPLSSPAKIVLGAGQDHDPSESEKISTLIWIWEWTEISLVLPEGYRDVCPVGRDADCGEEHNSTGKQAELK